MGGETDSRVLQRLDEWQKHELPGPIELYIRLMRAQIEGRSSAPTPGPHLSDRDHLGTAAAWRAPVDLR